MRRVTDPDEIERLKKEGRVVTSKSLWLVLGAGVAFGLLVNLAGLPRWPSYIGLLVVVFVTTYVLFSRPRNR